MEVEPDTVFHHPLRTPRRFVCYPLRLKLQMFLFLITSRQQLNVIRSSVLLGWRRRWGEGLRRSEERVIIRVVLDARGFNFKH